MKGVKWQIERIELIFYNGCDNRWAMFQNQEGVREGGEQTPETFFRAQAARLLQTVRTAMVKLAKETPATSLSFEDHRGEQRSGSVHLSFEGTDTHSRSAFGAYCAAALHREGVHDADLSSRVKSLESKTVIELPFGKISAFLSVLPIACDWDVFGWLQPMSSGIRRLLPTDFWMRFFVYRVSQKPRTTEVISDEQPLKRNLVWMQMLGDKGKNRAESHSKAWYRIEPDPRCEVPYFEFAKSPVVERHCDHSRTKAKMTEQEYAVYGVYAAAIDQLQVALGNPAATNHGGEGLSHNFYAVYPVIACGFYHFVHFHVRPVIEDGTNGNEKNVKRLLVDCRRSFHDLLPLGRKSYHIFKESLRELLVQIRLSAFQHYVTEWMAENRKKIHESKSPDRWALECFCEFAPILNEMRAITTADAVWAHAGHNGSGDRESSKVVDETLKAWVQLKPEDYVREGPAGEVTKITLPYGVELPKKKFRVIPIGNGRLFLWLFHVDQEHPFEEECFAGTNARRLEEQFETVQERMRRYWYAGRP